MSRIAALPEERAGLLGRLVYRFSRKKLGKLVSPISASAHNPWILAAYGAYELALERAARVDAKLKLLAASKVATMVGCPFCMDIGTALARKSGIGERQMRELATYRTSDAFSEVEKLVIAYAEEMTKTPVAVPDELFASLRRWFDDAQIVELTAEIAWENYRARFNDALDLEPADFAEGTVCLLPEQPQHAGHASGLVEAARQTNGGVAVEH
jgi:AhpD family alkylhydroperoxidase